MESLGPSLSTFSMLQTINNHMDRQISLIDKLTVDDEMMKLELPDPRNHNHERDVGTHLSQNSDEIYRKFIDEIFKPSNNTTLHQSSILTSNLNRIAESDYEQFGHSIYQESMRYNEEMMHSNNAGNALLEYVASLNNDFQKLPLNETNHSTNFQESEKTVFNIIHKNPNSTSLDILIPTNMTSLSSQSSNVNQSQEQITTTNKMLKSTSGGGRIMTIIQELDQQTTTSPSPSLLSSSSSSSSTKISSSQKKLIKTTTFRENEISPTQNNLDLFHHQQYSNENRIRNYLNNERTSPKSPPSLSDTTDGHLNQSMGSKLDKIEETVSSSSYSTDSMWDTPSPASSSFHTYSSFSTSTSSSSPSSMEIHNQNKANRWKLFTQNMRSDIENEPLKEQEEEEEDDEQVNQRNQHKVDKNVKRTHENESQKDDAKKMQIDWRRRRRKHVGKAMWSEDGLVTSELPWVGRSSLHTHEPSQHKRMSSCGDVDVRNDRSRREQKVCEPRKETRSIGVSTDGCWTCQEGLVKQRVESVVRISANGGHINDNNDDNSDDANDVDDVVDDDDVVAEKQEEDNDDDGDGDRKVLNDSNDNNNGEKNAEIKSSQMNYHHKSSLTNQLESDAIRKVLTFEKQLNMKDKRNQRLHNEIRKEEKQQQGNKKDIFKLHNNQTQNKNDIIQPQQQQKSTSSSKLVTRRSQLIKQALQKEIEQRAKCRNRKAEKEAKIAYAVTQERKLLRMKNQKSIYEKKHQQQQQHIKLKPPPPPQNEPFDDIKLSSSLCIERKSTQEQEARIDDGISSIQDQIEEDPMMSNLVAEVQKGHQAAEVRERPVISNLTTEVQERPVISNLTTEVQERPVISNLASEVQEHPVNLSTEVHEDPAISNLVAELYSKVRRMNRQLV